jgi:hypothetical protein
VGRTVLTDGDDTIERDSTDTNNTTTEDAAEYYLQQQSIHTEIYICDS